MSTQFVDLRPGVSRTFLDTFLSIFYLCRVREMLRKRKNSLISSVSRAYSETITTTHGERVCDAKLLIKWVAASRGNDQSLRESAAMEFHIIFSLRRVNRIFVSFLFVFKRCFRRRITYVVWRGMGRRSRGQQRIKWNELNFIWRSSTIKLCLSSRSSLAVAALHLRITAFVCFPPERWRQATRGTLS